MPGDAHAPPAPIAPSSLQGDFVVSESPWPITHTGSRASRPRPPAPGTAPAWAPACTLLPAGQGYNSFSAGTSVLGTPVAQRRRSPLAGGYGHTARGTGGASLLARPRARHYLLQRAKPLCVPPRIMAPLGPDGTVCTVGGHGARRLPSASRGTPGITRHLGRRLAAPTEGGPSHRLPEAPAPS